ncbi:gamma-aminobutyric acid receptor subunit pi-like [Convolutriloba macropyga]|uniref:gamma-aminobutyric acid receptor subunit pi-like n=1 Tax=Convolutriloba macropyga TaxID=536237 RepID=UPI003F528B65
MSSMQNAIHLALESIRSISADASFDFYLGLQWYDKRERDLDLFLSGPRTAYFAWIPDIYFILARKVIKTEDTQYLSISNGSMLYDRKVSVTTPCETVPFRYPFDSVTCKLFLSSYGYDDSKVNLQWSEDGISMPKSYQGLDYVGFLWAEGEATKILETEVSQYAGLEYSIIRCSMSFQRLYKPYVFQLFVPAAFLVVISWSTFWINISATPGRAGVGITTIKKMEI